jgi:hypothetical protein
MYKKSEKLARGIADIVIKNKHCNSCYIRSHCIGYFQKTPNAFWFSLYDVFRDTAVCLDYKQG